MGLDDHIPSTSSSDQGSPEKSVGGKLHYNEDMEEIPDSFDYNMSIEEFEKNLPETVKLLTTPEGSKVFVVGTAHYSLESQKDVSKVVQIVKPHIIMVELCPSRANILKLDEETLERESKSFTFAKIKAVIKEHGAFQGLMYIALLLNYARVTKDLGMAPGGEFRVAFAEAKKLKHCLIHYGDRPINVTIKRTLSNLSWWKTIKFFWILLKNQTISKEIIEECKQKDMLETMMAELAYDFPEINKTFVLERDIWLTYSLQLAAQTPPGNLFNIKDFHSDEPTRVVGVIGMGHAPGVAQHWMKVTDDMIPPLMLEPPPSRSSKIIRKTFKIVGVGLLLWGCYKFFPVPKSVSNTIRSLPIQDILVHYKSVVKTIRN